MAKISVVLLFILTFCNLAFAADITYELKPDRLEFVMNFNKGYSTLDVLKSDKMVVFSFETTEKLDFKRQDFFDIPVSSAYLLSENFRKKFVVSFENSVIEPIVSQGEKQIKLTFVFPKSTSESLNTATNVPQATPPVLPTASGYFRMVFGLGIVLIIILFLYWLVKGFVKKQVFTDIPGTGRLLGKVDIDIRKSLIFYEVIDTIYIIGVTDAGMNLIDKVTDDIESSKIRSGLSRKREFAGYMSFFKRKNELDADIETSNALLEEKLKSLRKK